MNKKIEYKKPSSSIKTSGIYEFITPDKKYIIASYNYERANDDEDSLEIQDELRKTLGSINIKNSSWKKLSTKGLKVPANSSDSSIKGKLVKIDEVLNVGNYELSKDEIVKTIKGFPAKIIHVEIESFKGEQEPLNAIIVTDGKAGNRILFESSPYFKIESHNGIQYAIPMNMGEVGEKLDNGKTFVQSETSPELILVKSTTKFATGGSVEEREENQRRIFNLEEVYAVANEEDKPYLRQQINNLKNKNNPSNPVEPSRKRFLGLFHEGGGIQDRDLIIKAIEYNTGQRIKPETLKKEGYKYVFEYSYSKTPTSIQTKLIDDTIFMHRKSLEGRTLMQLGGNLNLSKEQKIINKKVIKLLRPVILEEDLKKLIIEVFTELNFHSENFELAKLFDKSIKTKDDFYKSNLLKPTKEIRDLASEIAEICDYDMGNLYNALFVYLNTIGNVEILDSVSKVLEYDKSKSYTFNIGDVVWNNEESDYAVVLDNFGSPDGERGELRLDLSGMTSINDYDASIKNGELVYNIVPYNSELDNGNHDLSGLKESALRLIEYAKNDKSKSEYYAKAYNRLLAGEFDGLKNLVSKSDGKQKKLDYIKNSEIKFVLFKKDGKDWKVSGNDVLNGINMFEEGGNLTENHIYISKPDIQKVVVIDGDSEKELTNFLNGFWVNKSAINLLVPAKSSKKVILTKTAKSYIDDISKKTGVRPVALVKYFSENNYSDEDLLKIVIGLGREQLNPKDLMQLVVGESSKNSELQKTLDNYIKSNKAYNS